MNDCEGYLKYTMGAPKTSREGNHHAILKCHIINFLRSIGVENIATEFRVEGIGIVDVIGFKDEVSIAIECGNTSPRKIFALEKACDIVVHIPYCYTLQFLTINYEAIKHKLSSLSLAKKLRKGEAEIVDAKYYCDGLCDDCARSELLKVLGELK